ncbi:MAG TPA: hypothetical protein VF013_09430 [Candidatus Limnocylindria bacterium]
MIERLRHRQASMPILSRLERPEAVILALVQAGIAAWGWVAEPFWLSVALGAQLAIGGLGAVAILGAAQPGLGFARYATLAAAGVAVTLVGRVVVGATGLLLLPAAAALLWLVLWAELRAARETSRGLALDLVLVAVVFAAAAGIGAVVPPWSWPPGVILIGLASAIPALRSAEARGRSGAEAVGQAALHLLAVGQVATAVVLLGLPGVVGAALVALAFHAWSGAAEALDEGASGRAVVIEFGLLAAVGVVVALLLHGR